MIVVGIKNMYPNYFQRQLMVFANQEEAYGVLRRNFRDMYLADDFSMDEMMEKQIVVLADFDEKTGTFENMEKPVHMDIESMIWDLIGKEVEDDA